jgi:hypothetical protein
VRRFALVVDQLPDVTQMRALAPAVSVRWDPRTATVLLWFDRPTESFSEAVAAVIRSVDRIGLRALRVVTSDWVTAAEIAHRVGRSRETVRLWAAARIGPGGFPPPLNPGSATMYWSWAEVLPWLRTRMNFDLPDEEPTLVAADLTLRLRELTQRLR